MAKHRLQTTLFGTVVRELEGCIYTNPKDKYEQLAWILTVHDVCSFMYCSYQWDV